MSQVSTRTIILYASGNFGKSCLANLVEIYALFYFTDLLGIDPSVAGIALLASLILDALTDPLVGHLGDRLGDRWRTLAPFALVGVPLSILSFLVLFIGPELAGPSATPIAIAGLLVFRAAYTIFDVPHNGLLAVVTRTPEERTFAASLRIFFSALGKLAVTLVVALLVQRGGHGYLILESLSSAAFILAALFLVSASLCTYAVRRIVFSPGADSSTPARFLDIGKAIFGNRQVVIIFTLTAANSLMIPTIAAAFIYYAKYGLFDEAVGTRAVMLLAIAQTVSLPFWAGFTNRIGSKPVADIIAYLILAVAAALGRWFADDVVSIYSVAALTGFAVSGVFMLNWSMLPDALDRGSEGAAQTGRFGIFGVYTLTNKAFSGFAQAFVGLVLSIVGYAANSELAPGVIDNARMAIFALPMLGAIFCIVLLLRFDRTRTDGD